MSKVIFVGNARTGKTTIVNELLCTGSENNYIPTLGVEAHPYISPSGNKYNIWDCAGQKRFSGISEGYYIDADIAIIFKGGLEDENPPEYGNRNDYYDHIVEIVPYATVYTLQNPCVDDVKYLLP